MAAAEDGITSIMWQSAREASSMMSALCWQRSSWTSSGTKTSTERAESDSSVPNESSSHSSESEASCSPSSSDLRPDRMVLSRECDAVTEGRRSSSPAPSFRSRPWSALEGALQDWPPRPPLSSIISIASCSASSSCCRRKSRWYELPPSLLPAGPLHP
eukprot:6212408-Pleurochrysis_carterae.AAC.3